MRWAGDFVMGFQHQREAEGVLAAWEQRFVKFGLELDPEKTRLIQFRRFAAQDRADLA